RRVCLIELEHRGTRVIEEAIQAIAERFAADGSLAPALRDLLLRRPPRIAGAAGGPIRRDGEPLEAAYLRAVQGLEGSVLCVQGPPGSGKTSESAKVIAALVRAGRRVGITSNSHKAIVHLMASCAAANGGKIDAVKIGGKAEDVPPELGIAHEEESREAAGWLDRVHLIGGTAWCFARPE